MRVIISYMARDDDGDGAMHTYTTQRTHTRLTYALIRTPTPACMHACMLSRPPPRTAMKHCVYATTRTAPHNTHYTYISAVQPHTHTLQHTQAPQHIATHTQLRTACACHRDHDETGDKRQHRHTSRRPRSRRRYSDV